MTSHSSMNPRSDYASSHDSTSQPESAGNDARAENDLARMAEVVANGQVPFPTDLPESEAERLRLLVVCRRRKRLVTLIARAIARDIKDGFLKLQGGS